ncbi:glycosyltransferase family 4 protein [Cognatishimia activa]|uniref:Putative teichuronic acid biosynthesis glycosyltransferase TuaC n=1 Tax=Cognatishimia activa TaxID=1715691 RepID=A0A0P1IN34_9RHOB|nr:glycosyltransferase family 4 protein [Cognatishimia activa]CUJ13366.1 Putative teichuronic acid biosynthesis glycosyltransferase TuaC [Cognatishimia activa]CUK24959.1 Putative teichuronic acid biosynthesis glycosyltransferase TuaC [Cognatishimia activa]
MGALNKIAYLTGEYPRATDTFIQREVAALRAMGREVVTCSIRQTGAEHHVGPEQRAETARTFHVLKAAKSPLHLLSCHWRFLRQNPGRYFESLRLALTTNPGGTKNTLYQLFYFAEAAVLGAHLQDQDVTHLHNHIAKSSCSVAMLMSEMTGIPFSFTLHGPDIFFAPQHWRLDKKIEKARFVACISHFCRSQAMSFSTTEQWNKLHIVHCGVDPSLYSDAEKLNKNKFLFVGRLAAVKGIPVLLEALVDLPNAELTIVGDGPDRDALQAKARDLGVSQRVDFVGYKSQSDVAEYLKTHSVFVLPSFAEGVPVVLMEAMAAGLPVVTTKIAGVPELVEDGVSGRLVSPGEVSALAGALKEMSEDPIRNSEMGAAGRAQVISEFSVSKEAAWLSELFDGYGAGDPPSDLRPEAGQ